MTTEKHFEFTGETREHWDGTTLYRIRATRDLPRHGVKAGEEGGFVASMDSLSGAAWVYGDARVYGDAWVSGDARVSGDAWVYGDARVYGAAWVYGDARVYGAAWVYGDARVYGDAQVSGDARVSGDAWVYGAAWVYGDAQVSGAAQVYGAAQVSGDARVYEPLDLMWGIFHTSLPLPYTLTRTETGHHITLGCERGDMAHMRALCAREDWIETHGTDVEVARPELTALLDLMQARIDRWTPRDATPNAA